MFKEKVSRNCNFELFFGKDETGRMVFLVKKLSKN